MKKSIDEIIQLRRAITGKFHELTEDYRKKQESIWGDLREMQKACPHPSDGLHKQTRVEMGITITTVICTLCGAEVANNRNTKKDWGVIEY